MNAIEKILLSNDTISKESLNEHLPQLLNKSATLKVEMFEYIEQVESRYENRPKSIKKFLSDASKELNRAANYQNEISEDIKSEINETKSAINEYNKRVHEINIHLKLCRNLRTIHEKLNEANKLEDEAEILVKVCELEEFIEGIPNEEKISPIIRFLDQILGKKAEVLSQFSEFIYESCKTTILDKEDEFSSTVSLKKSDKLKIAFQKLSEHQENINPLDDLVRFLWDNVFSIIVNFSTKCKVEEMDGCSILNLSTDKRKKDDYLKVFENLKIVAEFLHKNINFNLNGETIMSYLGGNIRDNLSELIIKFCLEDTIPATSDGLHKYNEVIRNTEILQATLKETEIFSTDSSTILDYANNVDILFINKKCKEYMNLGLELMKKDLHDSIIVGAARDPGKLSSDEFSQCAISKNVPEILNLVERIITKATKSSEVSAGRLYTTSCNILHQYGHVVKEHHKKLLETIPQQVALFCNNCDYIVYELNTQKWKNLIGELPNVIKGDNGFENIQKHLQSISFDLFREYVQNQKKQIEGTIKNSGIDLNPSCEKIDPAVEKSIRQCLRQQELLKTVWQKVLNYFNYNHTMGDLLDSLCSSLCTVILRLEDISSEAAEQLVDLIKVVLTRGPKLFTEPKEINMYVIHWHKLSELVFILNSSLEDIKDRWADGKGPLALQFSGDDMKKLIRALFQNTDRRASVIANITATCS